MNAISPDIRILLLEDVPTDAELIETELRNAGLSFTSRRVQTKPAFMEALEEFQPDIILSDFLLPSFDGLSAIKIVQEHHPEVPVVIVTGAIGDEMAVELLKAGAKDYVLKDRTARLKPAIERVLRDKEAEQRRKLAELRLRESEVRFRQLTNIAPVFIWVVGADMLTTWVNQVWLDFTGRTLDQEIGNGWTDNIHPEDITQCLDTFTSHFDKREEFSMEYRMQRHDGEYRWIIDQGVPVSDDQGNFSGYIGSCIDVTLFKLLEIELRHNITERKVLEEKLVASSKEIEDLYDHSPCGYHSLGQDGIYQRINETELEWLGCKREEVIGRINFSDVITPDGKEQFRQSLPHLLNEGHIEDMEFDLVGKTGLVKHILLNATAIRDAHGNFLRSRSVIFDITELKKTQDELKQLTHEQLAMLDNELVGIMKLSNRRIIWKNKAVDRIFGYGPDEMVGKPSKILYPDDASYVAQSEIGYTCLKTHGAYRTQLWMVRKDGEKLWIDVNGANLFGAEDESLWLLADITPIKDYQEKIEHIAYHDNLTGLPNRRLVADRLNQALAQAKRSDQMLAVCFLDLDGFKPVNDSFGHAFGDKLLIEIAQRLQASIRANDTVGRLGGDEFVLLLTCLENAKEYQMVLDRVIQAINLPVTVDAANKATITASIGIALFPRDSSDPDSLLRQADQAMYAAKQNGRNRYQFFDIELERRISTRREMLGRIRQGLASGEFCLYFQPQVDFGRNTLAGIEALIRWQHPTLGLLEPAEFLSFVENDDLALTMGDWVIREALGQMQSWQRDGVNFQVSINVFARQLREPDFVASLQQRLSEHPDVPPVRLRLEITESAGLPEPIKVQQIIADCQQLSVGFSIDDFGTGYSSLLYLRHLPVVELKIDKSFVRGMLTNHQDLAIIEGIIALGRAFQRSVIAEGVETPEQIRRLLELGCNLMQGYKIARPMPPEQIVSWVRDFQPAQILS